MVPRFVALHAIRPPVPLSARKRSTPTLVTEPRGPIDPSRLPGSGREAITEVERLKEAPVRFRCLGMSFATLLVLLIIVWLIWRLTR